MTTTRVKTPVYTEARYLALAKAVLVWARLPGNHGGNPYTKDFVKLANRHTEAVKQVDEMFAPGGVFESRG
jgi:hypothetical protein